MKVSSPQQKSQSEFNPQVDSLSLTVPQKFGIKFYAFLISQITSLLIIIYTKNPNLAISFISFYNVLGTLIKFKVNKQRQNNVSKMQNKNKWIFGPLIMSCLSTPVIIAIAWYNYEQVVDGSAKNVVAALLAFSFMISSSIDASHQLLHRSELICRLISYFNLVFFQFTIYPTQHLYMHHKKVGTAEDPITSPKNQTVFKYFFKVLYSCYKFNFNYDKKIFAFNIFCTVGYNLLLFGLAFKEGSSFKKALFFSAISYVSLFFMEAIQYLQHYGLIYRAGEEGKGKNVTQVCSWNTTQNQLLNWIVFRFQRHSDHHMNAYKMYPTLQLTQKMPQIPFDFMTGALVATISPIWFKLMNPLVDQVIEGKSVTKEHRIKVLNYLKVFRFLLFVMFPLRLAEYLLASASS